MEKNIIVLNKHLIQSLLPLPSKNVAIELFAEIDSTNHYLKSCEPNSIRFCIAEKQTHGRGRLRREWHSPFGENIYLSMLYPFPKPMPHLAGLSLVMGLSVCKIAGQLFPAATDSFLVKWPNDILFDNQKLAGILIEIASSSADTCHAIVGIGLNVNMEEDSNQITQQWTSLKKITGRDFDRNILCAQLIGQLLHDMALFSAQGLTPFLEQWQARDSLLNQPVTVQNGSAIYAGKGLGINNMGQLLLETPEGKVLQFSSGDTMILKQ